MKTWIIILAILFVVFKLIAKGTENYIRNDSFARAMYKMSQGTSTPGIIYSIFSILSVLAFCTDCILLLIYFL